MDMLGGLMGGSDDAPKTWMATTTSEAYELITPRLQAKQGDVLRFEAELGGGGMMAMMGMFMGGGASGQLNVFYSLDNNDSWTYYDTFTQNGYIYFVAPYSGIYQLRFTSPSASLDNFYGFRNPIVEVAISDDDNDVNTAAFENYDGQTVNISYDRTLAATQLSDGSYEPRAFVVSLPYDYDLSEYYDSDQTKVFRLRFKEEYYQQFIFLPNDGANPQLLQAGRAYLVVVMNGQINLSGTGVKLNKTVVNDQLNLVYSFQDWYFEDKLTPVGAWKANFRTISDTEAAGMNIYGLRDDGTWARFEPGDESEPFNMSAFRGYFEVEDDGSSASRLRAAAQPGTYKTLFQSNNRQGTTTGENLNYENLGYEATIPYTNSTTGIEPTLNAVDADGVHYYFDLLGRPLREKPEQGIYIDNGQKVIHE